MSSSGHALLTILGLCASFSLYHFGCIYLETGILGIVSFLLVLFMAFFGGPPSRPV